MAVKADGHRFHDEAGPYWDRVEKLKPQPGQIGHYIFDDSTFKRQDRYVKQLAHEVVSANSLKYLAAIMSVPAKPLANSVRGWNDFVKSGQKVDPFTKRVDFCAACHLAGPLLRLAHGRRRQPDLQWFPDDHVAAGDRRVW